MSQCTEISMFTYPENMIAHPCRRLQFTDTPFHRVNRFLNCWKILYNIYIFSLYHNCCCYTYVTTENHVVRLTTQKYNIFNQRDCNTFLAIYRLLESLINTDDIAFVNPTSESYNAETHRSCNLFNTLDVTINISSDQHNT